MKFLGRDAALDREAVIAIEGRRDLLIESGSGRQVSRQLRGDELVERHVCLEGIDDPVAPWPLVVGSVVLIPVAVREAGVVEPLQGQVLCTGIGREQPVHGGVPRVSCGVLAKRFEVLQRRRQACEVERDAAQPGRLRHLWRGLEVGLLEPLQNESIVVIARPARVPTGDPWYR